MTTRTLSPLDRALVEIERALETIFVATPIATQPSPAADTLDGELDDTARKHAAGLMRVNHVGEVCAQALYHAQALGTADAALKRQFEAAALEETDHLAWTQQRLVELNAHPSLLNPLWYAGAFGIGLLAGRIGDATSLGFVVETERQVEAHLGEHLQRLPENDLASRAIVSQMQADEAAHAVSAEAAGAALLPAPARWVMRLAARVMTSTAHYI